MAFRIHVRHPSPANPRRLGGALALFLPLALAAACDRDQEPNRSPDAALGGGGGGASGGTGGTTGVPGAGGTPGLGGTAGAGGVPGTASTGGAASSFVDTDVVLARFTPAGVLDPSFGVAGIQRLNLSDGVLAGTSNVRDAPWGLAQDAEDRLLVFAARRAPAPGRVDTDRVVARLSPSGALDTSFGDGGLQSFGLGALNDNARNGIVDPDGKIVSAGYTNQPTGVGTQAANGIVLARLHGGVDSAGVIDGGAGLSGAVDGGGSGAAPGAFDVTFGAMGIVNHNPFRSADPLVPWGMAEAYAVTRQSTGSYVTVGYGRRAASGQVNVVAFRFTSSRLPDPTWATNGIFEKDLTSDHDRGRNLVALPGDRILIAGSATPTPSNVDALVMILDANGALDPTFNGIGYRIYKLDTVERPDEALFGAAVSPSGRFAAAAGYRSANPAIPTTNDDAALVILPLEPSGVEVVAAVPLSDTAADRFWAVTFDASERIVAAGYVTAGSDRHLAVARFNVDGTRDVSFGVNGLATVNAAAAGDLEEARGVAIQSDGGIVIMGTAEVMAP